MPFGVTPVGPTIPRTPPEFSEFIQFQSEGEDLSGPTVQVVNILSPLRATRGVGENAHVVTISRPDIPFITISLTGVQAQGETGIAESGQPLFYVPFTGDVADDVTANPAPATVGAGAIISGNAFQSQSPPTIDSTCGISWSSSKLGALTSGDFTLAGVVQLDRCSQLDIPSTSCGWTSVSRVNSSTSACARSQGEGNPRHRRHPNDAQRHYVCRSPREHVYCVRFVRREVWHQLFGDGHAVSRRGFPLASGPCSAPWSRRSKFPLGRNPIKAQKTSRLTIFASGTARGRCHDPARRHLLSRRSAAPVAAAAARHGLASCGQHAALHGRPYRVQAVLTDAGARQRRAGADDLADGGRHTLCGVALVGSGRGRSARHGAG